MLMISADSTGWVAGGLIKQKTITLLSKGPWGLVLDGSWVEADVVKELAKEQGPEQKTSLFMVSIIS